MSVDAPAPLGRIPLYVRAGSIIPAGPELQYATEKIADPITLYVFTGSNATFMLYEDEGVNYNYEQGAYSQIPINYDEEMHTLTIGTRQGEFKNMPEGRSFQIVWVKTDHPVGVGITAHPDQVVQYNGTAVTLTMK